MAYTPTTLTVPDGKVIVIVHETGSEEAAARVSVTRVEYAADFVRGFVDEDVSVVLPAARVLYIVVEDLRG
jgi:hypothetical protein